MQTTHREQGRLPSHLTLAWLSHEDTATSGGSVRRWSRRQIACKGRGDESVVFLGLLHVVPGGTPDLCNKTAPSTPSTKALTHTMPDTYRQKTQADRTLDRSGGAGTASSDPAAAGGLLFLVSILSGVIRGVYEVVM